MQTVFTKVGCKLSWFYLHRRGSYTVTIRLWSSWTRNSAWQPRRNTGKSNAHWRPLSCASKPRWRCDPTCSPCSRCCWENQTWPLQSTSPTRTGCPISLPSPIAGPARMMRAKSIVMAGAVIHGIPASLWARNPWSRWTHSQGARAATRESPTSNIRHLNRQQITHMTALGKLWDICHTHLTLICKLQGLCLICKQTTLNKCKDSANLQTSRTVWLQTPNLFKVTLVSVNNRADGSYRMKISSYTVLSK